MEEVAGEGGNNGQLKKPCVLIPREGILSPGRRNQKETCERGRSKYFLSGDLRGKTVLLLGNESRYANTIVLTREEGEAGFSPWRG